MNRRRLVLTAAVVIPALLLEAAMRLEIIKPMWANNSEGLSMPSGRYIFVRNATLEHPPKIGEVVIMRDPPLFPHPYLIKRVAGIGGQEFCWRADFGTHTIDGKPLPAPLREGDLRKIGVPEAMIHALKPWQGCRRLDADEIVGYGGGPVEYGSYDSRYEPIGPVKLSKLWGVYREPAS